MIKPVYSPPPLAEIVTRRDTLLSAMAANNLDFLVCVDPDNIFWLTNFANYVHERPFVLVLAKDGHMSFVVPQLEIPHVESRAIGQVDLVSYFEFPAPDGMGWNDRLSSLVTAGARVGVEATCPWFIHSAISGDVVAGELVERARYIKSDYELGRIQYASDNATDKMNRILDMAKPGLSAINMLGKIDKMTKVQLLLDAPDLNFFATKTGCVVQPPHISHDPHNFTNVMDLGMRAGGPNVALINGVYNGYGTEVERTFFLGTVPDAARKPFETMMEVRRLAFDMCKAGTSMHDLDAACNAHFRKAGYADNMLHRTGHSIGVTGHEGPFLAEGFHEEIRPGMLFTIEPGIYIDGVGGFRHSDTVLVTEKGNISLTPVRDSLDDLTLPIKTSLFPTISEQFLFKLFARMKGLDILNPAA